MVTIVRLGEGQYGMRPSEFDPLLRNTAGQVPGMHWKYGDLVGTPDAVEAALSAYRQAGGQVTENMPLSTASPIVCSDPELREYQREGVDFLLHHKRAILADDMGLGKTATTVVAAQIAAGNRHKVLVVCPNFVRGVWEGSAKRKGEIDRWWPDHGVLIGLTGAKESPIPDAARIVVIHYDILTNWKESLAAWAPDVVIFDEGHLLQNEKSFRSQAARMVCHSAEYRWLLTGTLMGNFPKDLWNPIDTISPNRMGSFFPYALRYCNATKKQVTPEKVVWDFSGSSNEEELNTRLKHFMIRRLKKDVSLQLPPKTRQVITVDIGGGKTGVNLFEIRSLLDRTADKKIADVCQLLTEHARAGKKIVCFTWRRGIAEQISNNMRGAGVPSECVHGGISAARRGKAVETARETSGPHVLAATIDSSGTGIDLSYADIVVFAELTWEPHKLLQAESRTHRYGVQNPVLIQYVIAADTQDEIIAATVVSKLDTFEAMVGITGENLGEQLRGSETDMMTQLYKAMGVNDDATT